MNTGTDKQAGAGPEAEDKTAKQKAAEDKATRKAPAAKAKQEIRPRAAKGRPKRRLKTEFIFPVFVVLIIAAVFVYLNQGLSKLEKGAAGDNADAIAELGRLEARLDTALSDFSQMQARLDELQAQQAALSATLAEAAALQTGVNTDYALAEIEHLLILASHKLALEQDVSRALAALAAADKRLAGLAIPGAMQARTGLQADMDRLSAIEQADLSGLGLYLSDLIERVDRLPLRDTALPEPEPERETGAGAGPAAEAAPEGGARGFFRAVWQELKSLVIISREEEAARPRLLPEQIYFLRANIKLELANARFAVFNRDTENLKSAVAQIQGWLNDHFDMSDTQAANVNDTLRRMQKLELALPEMNIDSTLESVRALAAPRQDDAGAGQ